MRYYAIKGDAKSNFEAIDLCAQKLLSEGCVTDKFSQNCIEREKKFPTGMPSEFPVAMPHSEISGVKEDAVCLLVLDHPVKFQRMDDDEVVIDAQMVFNLAITDPNSHMYVLQNLMKIFYSKETLLDLYNSDLKALPDKLSKLIECH